ncbi:MAG TPA: hypothetical protein VK338_02380 [Candidatus Nitrosocosmicus sp.]|nr:hypothetical protein [Candidatus Nitrosocosmicus sp.]
MFNNLKLPNINTRYCFFVLFFSLISIYDLFIHDPGNIIDYILRMTSVVVTAGLSYFLLLKLFKIKLNIWYFIITQIILILLIHPTNTLWYFPLTVGITVLLKAVVRFKGSPIFNPAGFGLFVTFYLTDLLHKLGLTKESLFVSWWGSDIVRTMYETSMILRIIPIILLLTFIYFAWRFRKLLHASFFAFTFIVFMLVYSAIQGSANEFNQVTQLIFALTLNAFAFLTLVMVSEPKTSPILRNHQITLGILGGVLLFVVTIYPLPIGDIDPYILGLIMLNLLTFLFKKYRVLG